MGHSGIEAKQNNYLKSETHIGRAMVCPVQIWFVSPQSLRIYYSVKIPPSEERAGKIGLIIRVLPDWVYIQYANTMAAELKSTSS